MRRNTSRNRHATTLLLFLTATLATKKIHAQWDIEESHTTASLRGIHNAGGGVAWASGTNGTVLRTEDGGYLWQSCTIPPGAEKLDFRGIQAFDENTAIVMSSGKGDLSRLYKTTDGCQTWHLLFTNPDKEGFWDAVIGAPDPIHTNVVYSGRVVGDPVDGKFTLLQAFIANLPNLGNIKSLKRVPVNENSAHEEPEPLPLSGESLFAASNSSFIELPQPHGFAFATGGSIPKPRVISSICYYLGDAGECNTQASSVPMASGPSAGIFSLAYRTVVEDCPTREEIEQFRRTNKNILIYGPHCHTSLILVAVGGDYAMPASRVGTASYIRITEGNFRNSKNSWAPAETPPLGYRSSVAYDPTQKLWITVGPNGTDISTVDGKNWRPLTPSGYDPPDADKNWNALSLPFVVGPHGRIGRLRTIPNPTK
jgi:hypothetical protein